MSLLSGLLQSFFHGCELLQFISILRFLNSLDLNDESITGLDIHSRLDLNFLVAWWLLITILILGNLLDLFPRLLSFGCSLHGLLLGIESGLLVSLVSLLLLGIVNITISLKESRRRLRNCLHLLELLWARYGSDKEQDCHTILHFLF